MGHVKWKFVNKPEDERAKEYGLPEETHNELKNEDKQQLRKKNEHNSGDIPKSKLSIRIQRRNERVKKLLKLKLIWFYIQGRPSETDPFTDCVGTNGATSCSGDKLKGEK